MKVRFDFPAEVVQERTALYKRILTLLAGQTYEAAQEANRLHLEWLQRYPDDYVALDAGEVISKTVSAYEREVSTALPDQAAQQRVATT
jgi:hypothetical protein